MKIAILGGGISGCSLGRMLAADGHSVTVLEKSERVGGLCKSRSYDGFTFDEAGGHIIFSKDERVLQWQLDRCGGEAGTQKTVRNTKIRWHDRWVPYPFENGVGHLTKEATVDCMKGYVEAYVGRRTGAPCPENFGDWIQWRMGDGFARHFMVPYNNKIWKRDLTTMASDWVAGRVPEAPIEDILRSTSALQTRSSESARRATASRSTARPTTWSSTPCRCRRSRTSSRRSPTTCAPTSGRSSRSR